MKKVLVTGATGFIGNYVVQNLLANGHIVIASSANESSARRKGWFSRVIYRPLDFSLLSDDQDYFRFFDRPDTAIHLTWEGLPNYNAGFHLETNLARHQLFLKNLVRNGLKNLNVTGTCFEYGMQEGCLSETLPAKPANPYAQAKHQLQEFVAELQSNHPFAFKWIRLFYMYGKGQNPKSLLSQLQKALDDAEPVFNMSGGEQTRDFLPVTLVAEYIVQIALQTEVEGVINCCSGVPITVKKLVEGYLQKQQKTIKLNLGYYPYPDYEPMHFWGDKKRLNKIINKRN